MPAFLDQLKSDYATISAILQKHAHPLNPQDLGDAGEGAGVQILMKIYLDILQDALTTINSLIQFLQSKT